MAKSLTTKSGAACLRLALASATVLMLGACAATSENYRPPEVRGNEPAMVISGTRQFQGSGCLATIVVDGKVAGTVGAQETLVLPVKPGQYFVRWDAKADGLCSGKEDLAHRLVVVRDGPVLLRLATSGTGKMFIPVVGLFAQPEHRIVIDGED